MAHPRLEPRECENPDCSKLILPYNRNHRVCENPECKLWLQNRSRRPKNRYKLKKEFIHEKFDKAGYELAVLYILEFTKDDIEKVEE